LLLIFFLTYIQFRVTEYYYNNLNSTFNLILAMKKANIKKIIFSSSATLYGQANSNPISEDSDLRPKTPYGNSKLFIEKFLNDIYISDKSWRIVILRYFNPVGAHSSGIIGENSNNKSTNLMPVIGDVALGKRKFIEIYGNDYLSHDGTCVRDFIHVMDLALGHISALYYINNNQGIDFFNLGTGQGTTVLTLIKTFEKATGVSIPYEIVDRRIGDIDLSFACPEKANKILKWDAKKNINDMCLDYWNWLLKNN